MKKFQLKIWHKGLLLVTVPLFFQLIFVGVLQLLLDQSKSELAAESHSRINIELASSIANNMLLCPGQLALYLVSKDRSYLDKCQTLAEEALLEVQALKQSVTAGD